MSTAVPQAEVWLLFQGSASGVGGIRDKKVQGVYDNEDAAVSDRERLGGSRQRYSVERWAVDSEPVAPPIDVG